MNKSNSKHIKHLRSQQNPKGENIETDLYDLDDIEADTLPYCERLIIDSIGDYCCIYQLDAPSYCTPENCPHLEGVVQ